MSEPAPSNPASSLLSLFSLQGQTAIITGCTRGIGHAMALALASAGATVILAQRNVEDLTTQKKIEEAGGKALVHQLDVSSPESVAAFLPAVLAAGHLPTILVTAAGIQRRHNAHEFPDDDWHAVLQANLHACFSLARAFAAHLLTQPAPPPGQKRGSVVLLASLMTFQGGLFVPAYAASKGAIGSLTKALSNEWSAHGINVNAVAPGYIHTDMTDALVHDESRGPGILARIPAGRWGSPDDFAGVVIFLASRASSYVCGEIVTVDGGWMGR